MSSDNLILKFDSPIHLLEISPGVDITTTPTIYIASVCYKTSMKLHEFWGSVDDRIIHRRE